MRADKIDSIARPTQAGFTLIEFIMVIVILGVLAATALPRFVSLRGDANEATIRAMGGAILAGASLIFAKSAILGVQAQAKTDIDIDSDGVNDVEVEYGYPSAHRINGIPKVMGANFASGWTWSGNAANTVFFSDNLSTGKTIRPIRQQHSGDGKQLLPQVLSCHQLSTAHNTLRDNWVLGAPAGTGHRSIAPLGCSSGVPLRQAAHPANW